MMANRLVEPCSKRRLSESADHDVAIYHTLNTADIRDPDIDTQHLTAQRQYANSTGSASSPSTPPAATSPSPHDTTRRSHDSPGSCMAHLWREATVQFHSRATKALSSDPPTRVMAKPAAPHQIDGASASPYETAVEMPLPSATPPIEDNTADRRFLRMDHSDSPASTTSLAATSNWDV
jgi:hypothetical protein